MNISFLLCFTVEKINTGVDKVITNCTQTTTIEKVIEYEPSTMWAVLADFPSTAEERLTYRNEILNMDYGRESKDRNLLAGEAVTRLQEQIRKEFDRIMTGTRVSVLGKGTSL